MLFWHHHTRRPSPHAAAMAPDLPTECLHAIFERLPPNCIPLAIRQLSKDMRQHYLQHTTVQATDVTFLPAWAVLAAVPDTYTHPSNGSATTQRLLMLVLVRHGELAAMRRMLQMPQPFGGWFMDRTLWAAAESGNLDVLQWSCEQHDWARASCACTAAASAGHVHVLTWLRTQQPPFEWGDTTCRAAARGGHLETLQWLRARGCPWDRSVSELAARAGNLGMLRWCLANGCPGRREHLVTSAAMSGELSVLQYLKDERHFAMSTQAMRFAALKGHLHVLRWLHEQLGELVPWCWTAAVTGGHVAVLQYCQDQHCPFPADAPDLCITAAAAGRTEVLAWLQQHGHAWGAGAAFAAAQHCQFNALGWLRNQEPPCPWDSRVTDVLVRGPLYGHCSTKRRLQCLQWALDEGCPWQTSTYRLAQANQQLQHVRFPGVRRSKRLLVGWEKAA